MSVNNLAIVLYSQGKYSEGEEMNRQTLELAEKVLGKEHPHTLMRKRNHPLNPLHNARILQVDARTLVPKCGDRFTKVCVTYLSFHAFESGFCQTDAEFE
jgi:hypothetical protein